MNGVNCGKFQAMGGLKFRYSRSSNGPTILINMHANEQKLPSHQPTSISHSRVEL